MISVKGQFYFDVSLPNFNKSFIQEEDLGQCVLIERSGNLLPEMQLVFKTRVPEVLFYLNEGNSIDIALAKDRDDIEGMIHSTFNILSTKTNVAGDGFLNISITGVLDAAAYAHTPRIQITDKVSAIEAVVLAASRHFKLDSQNPSASKDSQNWVQPGISDRAFINKTWMHAWAPDSFYAVAVPADRHFIIRDMKVHIGSEAKWTFSPRGDDQNSITCDPIYLLDSHTGFNNAWVGYGREKLLYNLEDGTDTTILEDIRPMMSHASSLSRNSSITKKLASSGIVCDNVHGNYWNAYNRNLQGLITFSTVSLTLQYHNRFDKIKPLDMAFFLEKDPTDPNASLDVVTGKYIVGKVSRKVMGRQITTTVVLHRETLAGVLGALR